MFWLFHDSKDKKNPEYPAKSEESSKKLSAMPS